MQNALSGPRQSVVDLIFSRIGLQARMIASLVLLLSFLMMFMTAREISREKHGIFNQMRKDGIALARGYALGIENALLLDNAGLSRLTGEAGLTKGIEFLQVVDTNGIVIGHTDATRVGKKFSDPLYENALHTSINAMEKGKTPATRMIRNVKGEDVFCVIMPLVTLGTVDGVLEIGLETSGISRAIEETNRQSAKVAIVVMLIGVIVIWLFARSLVKPIRHLAAAAGKIASGDLDQVIVVKSKDEIGYLAASFRYMTRKLRENMNSLRSANEELQRNVSALENLRTYIENILNSVEIGIMTTDLDTTITYLNKAGRGILGLERLDTIGKKVDDILPQDHFLRTVFAEMKSGTTIDEARAVKMGAIHSGDMVLSVNADFLYGQQAAVVGYLAAFENVTELRQLQNRFQHEEKMGLMGRLAAGIAHEVRNPLGAMKTCAQFLAKTTDPEDQRYHFIQLIIREAKRMDGLISRLLTYARPGESDVSYGDINAVVDNAIELASLRANQLHVKIAKESNGDIPRVFFDEKRLSQAILNLLLNSLDFIGETGKISVATSFDREHDSVQITIADTGKGIPKEHQEKIFDPFFTTRTGGTGLGLAIVQQIIFEHNGTIGVQSAVGSGTTFTIALPVHAQQRRADPSKVLI